MFEARTSQSPGGPKAARVEALVASGITEWKSELTTALMRPSGLDDAGRVDAIRALEEAACVITAAQAQLARELDASQRAEQAAAGERAERQGKGVAAQLAFARRESHHRGRQHLGLAKVVPTELPRTWAAWRAGRITEWRTTIIARETACLKVEDRLEVDWLVAADADRLEAMGDRQVAAECAKHAARLDAASVTARRRKAESERQVTLRPAPDTMSYVTALLPIKDGVAVHAVLTRAAATARAAGDERTKGQVMADFLVTAVLDAGARQQQDQTTWGLTRARDEARESPDDQPATQRFGPRIELGLVMTDQTLFGTSDDPAHLTGFGPIPAELAREIVAGGCGREEEVWLRRLYASPETAELVSMDARGRFFRGSLARFIRLRDQVCRSPWCDAPIRQVDHVRGSAEGGETSGHNGQGLREACNDAKEAPGWRARPGPDGTIETTTPTGHTYAARPPAVATIHRREALRIDYILTG